jgi:hypothetical protein
MRKGFDSLAAVVRDWLGGDRVKLLWWDKDGLVQYGRGRVPDKIERKEEIHDLTEAEMAALGGAENLDAVCRGPRSQEIRPQGTAAGESSSFLMNTRRSFAAAVARSNSRSVGESPSASS